MPFIEGAARIGDRIYWITSHGANRESKPRPARRRFFATDVIAGADRVGVKACSVASPHIADLLSGDNVIGKRYRLEAKAKNAPESVDGLNIDGLAARPDGSLLIGFRNPVPGSHALIVPLKNPSALVTSVSAKPDCGEPIELDLGGLGIRSIELVPNTTDYLIVAGPAGNKGTFALFGWRQGQTPLRLNADIPADFRRICAAPDKRHND